MRRTPALGILALLAVGLPGPALALPDLAVPRDGFSRQLGQLRIVVENLGDAASPATEVELSDRPFLGGPTGTSSHYRPVRGLDDIWIDQEPAEGAVRLTVHLGRGREPLRSRGRVQFRDTQGVSLEEPVEGVSVESGPEVTWNLELPPQGAHIVLRVPAAPGRPPRMRLIVLPEPGRVAPPVFTYEGRRRGNVDMTLDCLDRPAARRERLTVPALGAGERAVVATAFEGGALGEVLAWVDPDDRVDEIREGNNVSTWSETRDRWTLAALHVHSCFSEGSGSFDWQALYAALSGYDLVWWSEHDWRMSCRDHLENVGFEDDEDVVVDFDGAAGTRAEYSAAAASTGAQGLLLATPPEGGVARARIRSERKRLTYALAAGIDAEIRLRASRLQAGDVIVVGFDLSRHPWEARSLVYELRWEGSPPAAGDGEAEVPWTKVIERTVPTGGWVPVRFPLTRDAEAAWANGSDDNLVGIRVELRAAGAAEVALDDLTLRHGECGEALVRVQEEWSRSYPNLAQGIGGEVSFSRPHLTRYGGDRSLVLHDLERRVGDPDAIVGDAQEVVRVVHASSGVVSWCHPLGTTMFSDLTPEQFDKVITLGIAGVDALEVGYRERAGWALPEYLKLWDRVCAGGVVVTALGVNDSHYNQWAPWENNFGTWLEAPADDEPALLRALREGRAFFGDPLRFRGRLELQVGAERMGGIVVGEGPRTVRVRVTDGGSDLTVRLLGDGKVLHEWPGVSGSGVLGEQLAPGQVRTVRAEVWSADGEPLAFTNPIFLDPDGTLRRSGE